MPCQVRIKKSDLARLSPRQLSPGHIAVPGDLAGDLAGDLPGDAKPLSTAFCVWGFVTDVGVLGGK